jgi:hypothetical protein
VGAEGGEAVVVIRLFVGGKSLLWDAWDAGAEKMEVLKDFAEKKLAGEFTYFELYALKSFKSLEINKRLQVAHLGAAAVEFLKVGEAPQRL